MPPLLRGAVKLGSGKEDSHETPVPREASQTPPATWASALGRFVPRWGLLTREVIRKCIR